MSLLDRLFAWLPEPGSEFGGARESARRSAFCAELFASARALASLKGQLDHYIDQAIRARAERDRAERARNLLHGDNNQLRQYLGEKDGVLAQALAEKADLERSTVLLTDIAEGLRNELREVRAGLAVGALRRRKGTR